jgi:predicted transcriptional regulator YdeE
MNKITLPAFRLIGKALKTKTWNDNGQSAIDCGNLWQLFETGNYANKIPGKLNNEIVAVYYAYEGDYTLPYAYFIGCKVNENQQAPDGMDSLFIPAGQYQPFTAKGTIPNCIASTWNEIWNTEIDRTYQFDFEIYDERSRDWNNAEVDIFISLK